MQLVSKPCARIQLTLLDLNDNRPLFYLFYDESDNKSTSPNSHNHHVRHQLDFYLEENSTENTFVAWLKAFDPDAAENATITYKLDSTLSSVPFWIDPHGIVRNSKRIRLIDEDRPQIGLDSSPKVYLTKQRTFLVKITATDSSTGLPLKHILSNLLTIMKTRF